MGMTITEKILAGASGAATVKPGDIVNGKIDYVMVPDGSCHLLNEGFRKLDIPVWDKDKVVLVIDHASPPCVVSHTQWVMDTIKFAEDYDITHFYNMRGVGHQIMPEDGFVKPGALIVGADSHTTTYGALGAFSTGLGATDTTWALAMGELWFKVPETIRVEVSGKLGPMVMGKDIILKLLKIIGVSGAQYRALEFGGEAIRNLSMDCRLTITNMAVEAGAKNGIIETDEITMDYLKDRVKTDYGHLASDKDCTYFQTIEIEGSALEPMVALPHNPGNVVSVSEAAGKKIDQVLLGSCTGGRMEDYRIAAEIMKGKKIPRNMRCLVMPASTKISKQIVTEGLAEIFYDAGCIISSSQCGPCGGMQVGFIGPGEACLGTHNRNFRGRMGSPDADIYLSSPATAAATALTGCITDPRAV